MDSGGDNVVTGCDSKRAAAIVESNYAAAIFNMTAHFGGNGKIGAMVAGQNAISGCAGDITMTRR